jgi:hypothetical protein
MNNRQSVSLPGWFLVSATGEEIVIRFEILDLRLKNCRSYYAAKLGGFC